MARKPSTYDRFKLAETQLRHLIEFLHYDNKRVETLTLGGTEYRVTKQPDGSSNIQRVANNP